MGCNYSYDNSENDFEIVNNNHNYLIVKKDSNKKNKEVYMKSVIDDYKILNENSKNFKKINPKSKRKEKYPLVRLKPQKNNIRQDKNTINQKVILNTKLN